MTLALDVDVVKVVNVVNERLEHDFVVFELEGGFWMLVQASCGCTVRNGFCYQ